MNDDQRWEAIRNRDQSLADAFIIGVQTTGIFCRPGCPARTPKRTNIEYFDTHHDAIRAGYRPCKRCRPMDRLEQLPNRSLVTQSLAVIADDPETDLAEVAATLGISADHFRKSFTTATGTTPKAYAQAVRARRLRQHLGNGRATTVALVDAGYPQSGDGYRQATRDLGMRPRTFVDKARGERIRWTITDTWLGPTLIAATDTGVCRIMFDDDPDHLESLLTSDFANAELIRDDASFSTLVDQTIRALDEPATAQTLPVDLRGTIFQVRVWNALRSIPAGTRVSYSELAAEIDMPQATRAVASACARNNVAVLVPCHRVVGKSGALTGYRWGVDRKRRLLERESTAGTE